jgi:peptidoglycan/LPS O-acetylase OafA/YrhL
MLIKVASAAEPAQKFAELESIRGIAALLVVFHHMPGWNERFYNVGALRNGHLMVELFFVLSGFVIFRAYAARITTWRELARFQFLRFGRLYPVHILFLFSFVLIELAKYIAQAKFGIVSSNTTPFKENSWAAFWQQVFLVQSIGPTGNATTFNSPAWSISVEFYTYLVFALVALFANRMKVFIFFVIFIVSTLLLASKNTFGFEKLLSCTTGFFLGCLTGVVTNNVKGKLHSSLSLIALCSLISFVVLKPQVDYDIAIYFLTAALILALVLTGPGLVKSVLNWPVLTWLGTISYSIYMCHDTVIWFVNQLFRIVLKKPEMLIDGHSEPQLSNIETIVTYLIIGIVVLAISQLTYTFIEKPLRAKSREVAFESVARNPT